MQIKNDVCKVTITEFTSIEDLELSVKGYNVLKCRQPNRYNDERIKISWEQQDDFLENHKRITKEYLKNLSMETIKSWKYCGEKTANEIKLALYKVGIFIN